MATATEPIVEYDKIRPVGVRDKVTTREIAAINEIAANGPRETAVVPYVGRPLDLSGRATRKQPDSAFVAFLIREVLAHFARWPGQELENGETVKYGPYLTLATLWAISTWMTDIHGNLLFNAHPRLFPVGDQDSGKTQLMEILRAIVRNPSLIYGQPFTAPGIRDSLNLHETVFIDEVHGAFGIRGTANQPTQGLVRAYKKSAGAVNARNGGHNVVSTFGPMVLAAQPVILEKDNLSDIIGRSIVIPMEQAEDKVPRLDNLFEQIVEPIPDMLSIWAAYVRPKKGTLWPVHTMPEGLSNRSLEIMEPMMAAADRLVTPEIVAEYGADPRWATLGRDAAQEVFLGHSDDGETMLENVRDIFRERGMTIGEGA